MDQRLLNIAELSTFLNISKSSIYSYAKDDKIPHIKLEGRLLFSQNDINKWLETKKSGTAKS
jgi:excisionase family DNA binding protein